jgi:xanthine phosphoribosyltransferase
MMDKLVISWRQFLEDTMCLAQGLKASGQTYDCIAAITRGGLVPACILSRELGIRYIDTVCISLYEDKRKKEHGEILKSIDKAIPQSKRWLCVDEIADSGHTARVARRMMPAGTTVVSVYAKPSGIRSVDLYEIAIGQDVWAVFPWEPESL